MNGPENIITVETMWGYNSESPYVRFTWGEKDFTLTPDEARKHAIRILEVAANSEADAAFIRYLRERLKVPKDELGAVMRDFRAMRS